MTLEEDNSSLNKPESVTSLTLRVKSSAHPTKDLKVSTERDATVEQLKESIRSALGSSTRGRYLRLIASGRLLAPDTAGLENFSLKEGSVVHAVLSVAGVRGGQQALLSRATSTTPSRRYRGSGIGPSGLVVRENNIEDSDSDDVEEGRERLGLDRLRTEGLSRNEITALRTYFARQINRFVSQQNQLGEEDADNHTSLNDDTTDDAENIDIDHTNGDSIPLERLRMEDRWMEMQGPHSEFRLNLNTSNPLLNNRFYLQNTTAGGENATVIGGMSSRTLLGSERDFIWGFVLGYFLGFMMMFWVWLPTVPHKQKLGILTGLCCQLGFKMLSETQDLSAE